MLCTLLTLCMVGLGAPLLAIDPPKKLKPEEVRNKCYRCWLELDRVDAGVAIKDPVAPWAVLELPAKGKDYAVRPKSFDSTKENKVTVSTYKPTEFWGVD
ncbi:MAG TPA: hypothetical protein VLM40_02970 [Gemmata sp.]|nr:hypothetical protein [Gemmata sp.]